jgi:acetyl esterase/lipase
MTTRQASVLGVACLGLVGSITPARAGDDKPAAPAFAAERHADIAYRTDPGADKDRHTLDLYCPKGQKDFPVVVFVHGGAWKWGNKDLYAGLGETFAKAGIGVVICNYRLSPKVQHPAHAEDVAKAVAWTCANVGKYGGDPGKLFLVGHSAGGHIVALLATDPTYLKAEKRSPADVKGVVAISGVYRIAPVAVFKAAFGTDAEVCKKASPLEHVTGGHPPFLIAYAESDYPKLGDLAKDMHAALEKADCSTDLLECKERNHITIITAFLDPEDALNKAFREFLAKHAK